MLYDILNQAVLCFAIYIFGKIYKWHSVKKQKKILLIRIEKFITRQKIFQKLYNYGEFCETYIKLPQQSIAQLQNICLILEQKELMYLDYILEKIENNQCKAL